MNLTNLIKTEYETITSQSIGELKKSQSSVIINIFSLWEETFQKNNNFMKEGKVDPSMYEPLYATIAANALNYTPSDITSISIALKEYEKKAIFSTAGSLLSALVNHYTDLYGIGTEYLLITEHLEEGIMHLGMKNKGRIKIDGDCGGDEFSTGTNMRGGVVHIFGNCNSHLGFAMEYGSLIVENNVIDGSVGTFMKNGKIEIKGSHIGNDVGHTMRGGSITVHGTIEGMVGSSMIGGSIFIYDKNAMISSSRTGGEIYCNGKKIKRNRRIV